MDLETRITSEEVANAFASVCKKCGSDPCRCTGKPVARTINGPSGEVCVKCRRNAAMCICQSHHPVVTTYADVVLVTERRPYTEQYVNSMVNEAMQFYYGNDANGLARWLNRALR